MKLVAVHLVKGLCFEQLLKTEHMEHMSCHLTLNTSSGYTRVSNLQVCVHVSVQFCMLILYIFEM